MYPVNKYYDVCILLCGEVSSDARSLNLARTLERAGRTVAIIAFANKEEKKNIETDHIHIFQLQLKDKQSATKLWIQFNKESHAYINKCIARYYLASDLYTLFSAYRYSKIHKSKLVYDAREIYSAMPSLKNRPIRQFIQTVYEKWLSKKVDQFITSGKLDEDYLRNHFKIDKPFEVIMNLPPYRLPKKSNLIREKYNIPDNIQIIIYQGMLMKGRGLSDSISAMCFIENAILCIVGNGPYEEHIRKLINALNLSKKVFLVGRVHYDQLHDWTCSADIGLVIIKPLSFSYKLALPNKLFEYAMAGTPSIASDLPAIRDIVDKYKIGKIVPTGCSPQSIAKSIKEVIDTKEKYIQNCLESAKELCYETQDSKLHKIFQ